MECMAHRIGELYGDPKGTHKGKYTGLYEMYKGVYKERIKILNGPGGLKVIPCPNCFKGEGGVERLG